MHFTAYYCILFLTVLAALWRGRGSEKLGAFIVAVGSLTSSAFSSQAIWSNLAVPVFVIDVLVLASFWWLALFSSRFWPYWATGWQLVGSLIHVQRAMFDDIMEKPYGILSMYIAYPILLIILLSSLKPNREPNFSQ